MDAITYLISRRQGPPYKLSAILAGVCLTVLANTSGLDFLERSYSLSNSNGFSELAYFLASILNGFAGLALMVGVLVALPLFSLVTACGTLKSWSENRILEELSCTGLTNRYLVDQLLRHHIKRWAIVAAPTLVLGLGYMSLDVQNSGALVAGLLLYFAAITAVFMTWFCLTAWYVSVGTRGWLFLLLPTVALFAPPVLASQIALSSLSAPALYPVACLLGCAYTVVAGRFLAIRALEGRAEFENRTFKLRRRFAIRRSGGEPLSENPIVARQEMIGREFGDTLTLFGMGAATIWANYEAFANSTPEPLYLLLLLVGFVAAWKAAARLSQSLTQELEGSTLETIRSTPMGSDRFLKGWLAIVVPPLTREVAVFVALCLPMAVYIQFPEGLTNGHLLHCALIAMAAPYMGGLVGASIAGQCRPRNEVSGQIATAIVLCSLLGAPQMEVLLHADNSWFAIFSTLVVLGFASWVLNAGATKSLNRVFLPQK